MKKFKLISSDSASIDALEEKILEYLNFLIVGDGKRAHCPFVKNMMKKKKFFYRRSNELLNKKEVTRGLLEMDQLSLMDSDRYAVFCIVYEEIRNYDAGFSRMVEECRQEKRLEYIRKGTTIAWTHPENHPGTHTNKDKGDYPLWISKAPMLMLRKLDKGDEPFMISKEAQDAFSKGILK